VFFSHNAYFLNAFEWLYRFKDARASRANAVISMTTAYCRLRVGVQPPKGKQT